jgi:hypothetical protein
MDTGFIEVTDGWGTVSVNIDLILFVRKQDDGTAMIVLGKEQVISCNESYDQVMRVIHMNAR